MITDADIQKLSKVFKTKEESDEDFKKLVVAIASTRVELRADLDNLTTKDDFNKVMDKLDFVIGELKTIRIEQAAQQASHERIDEDLKRIKAVPVIAHSLKGK